MIGSKCLKSSRSSWSLNPQVLSSLDNDLLDNHQTRCLNPNLTFPAPASPGAAPQFIPIVPASCSGQEIFLITSKDVLIISTSFSASPGKYNPIRTPARSNNIGTDI